MMMMGVMMGMGMLRVLMRRARPMMGMVLGMVPAIPLKSLLEKLIPWPTHEAATMKRKLGGAAVIYSIHQ